MAQGKLKTKAKLPGNIKSKQKPKGGAVTKRANRPIKPKKAGKDEIRKLNQIVTKTVNSAIEQDIRNRAIPKRQTMSKAQQAVSEHHKKSAGSKTIT
ncbi:unnamed protein product [Acanthoscelides obtectus]|uniref:Leydig cell tumor 10 kDa protein homolog n=1 Tax=Acanthoscelides obtectus TaxID=200917 RepID=A0A9P0PJT0_ACAOB|nr:unnamed protein product [Acanthoscelides obtectus]CAK1650840.1 hypothetical protein AOBTE_LOCUS16926 [Acanthoscelides obtectus]